MNDDKKLKVGDIYEDCAYHPSRCVKIEDDDVYGISLVDKSGPRICSLLSCGIIKLTEEETQKLLELWKNGKRHVLIHHAGFSEAAADELLQEWGT